MASSSDTADLLEKIRGLPDDKIADVIDFVNALRAQVGSSASQPEAATQSGLDAGENIEAWAAWVANGPHGPVTDDDEPAFP